MVGLPSLGRICTEELQLDGVAQKKLLADTKAFRTAWVWDNRGSEKAMSSKEMAVYYLTEGNKAKGIKPGRLLWQTFRTNIETPQRMLPRDDEIVLRGVERVFEKWERYARDKRRTHGRTTADGGQATSKDEDEDDDDDDELPEVRDLVDALRCNAGERGTKERENQFTQDSPCTSGNQPQDKPSAQADHILDCTRDSLFNNVPLPPDDPKDEEYYEPSSRLSDKPRRLPATRKEIERRNHLPASQRSRESTLIPTEEAINLINKRKRNHAAKKTGSLGTADGSTMAFGDEELRYATDTTTDTTSVHKQTPASRRKERDVAESLFVAPQPTPPTSVARREHTTMRQQASKRQKLGMSPQALNSSTDGHVSGENCWPNIERRVTHGSVMLDDTVPSLSHEREVPDSPLFVSQNPLDSMPVAEGGKRSQTPESPRASRRSVMDEDDRKPWVVGTRETSLRSQAPSREDSIDLGSVHPDDELTALRQSAGTQADDRQRGQMSGQLFAPGNTRLPPRLWILTTRTPPFLWTLWDGASLETVTLDLTKAKLKSHLELDRLTRIKIRFSDRKQEWMMVLSSWDELQYQDIKATVAAKIRIRDVYFSPDYRDC
ncbi:MAG: hypothetical protein Q9166_002052 [cf. Caloplaca sp. 2 TL-2023]